MVWGTVGQSFLFYFSAPLPNFIFALLKLTFPESDKLGVRLTRPQTTAKWSKNSLVLYNVSICPWECWKANCRGLTLPKISVIRGHATYHALRSTPFNPHVPRELKVTGTRPLLANQCCIIYENECNLFDAIRQIPRGYEILRSSIPQEQFSYQLFTK